MEKLASKYQQIINFCENNSNAEIIIKYSKYFREGYDAYGVESKLYEKQRDHWIREWEEEMNLDDYLDLGDQLVAIGKYEPVSFAIQLTASKKKDYTPEAFERIGKWLENGIQNWANTDVLCMVVLDDFISQKVINPDDFLSWNTSPSKWKRRAVPVTFVEVIKKGYPPEPILTVIEPLMTDEEEDVQKGLGTLLREMWKKYPELTEEFLMKWKNECGRKIIQYATEKMDKAYRVKFKKDKVVKG